MTDGSGSTGAKFATRDLDIERRILRARSAAVTALEQGNWDAVVLSCGKVLQEVARNELPYNEHSGTLPQLLERLGKRLQTDQPVTELAVALKDAGGLRGFFDLESDMDEELARATLSVIESFLVYTYAFREEVQRWNALVSSRRDGTSTPPAVAPAERPEAATWREMRTGAVAPAGAARDRDESARAERATDAGARDDGGPGDVAFDDSARDDSARDDSARDDRARDASEREDEERSATRPSPRRQEREQAPSAFDRFDERHDDPIRQTWRPPRSED
jgi:hypothetical protein